MYTFCIIMICVASILLILAVLVQSPKSGMAANFGAANQTMGVRQTTDFLEKFTWAMVAAIVFFSLLSTTALPGSVGKVEQTDVEAENEKIVNEMMGGDEESVGETINVTPNLITDETIEVSEGTESAEGAEGAEGTEPNDGAQEIDAPADAPVDAPVNETTETNAPVVK